MNTIIETRIFSKKAASILSQSEYEKLLIHIANNPRTGEVVSGTGGVRKLRWGKKDICKRGGIRIIYFNSTRQETWLLALYAKNERE